MIVIQPMALRIVAVVVALAAASAARAGEAFDHVHLSAPDTLKAAEWYANHFGGRVTKSLVFDSAVFDDIHVKFKKPAKDGYGKSVGSGVDHIGFSTSYVARKIDDLVADGAKLVQEARQHEAGFVYGFVEDPWGTKIEVIDDPALRGFHHVHLKLRGRDAALAWFRQAFGGEATFFKDDPKIPILRYGRMILAVREAEEQTAATDGRAVDHIGWKTDDLDALAARLRTMGAKFVVEPRVAPQFGIKLAFIESPGGVKIEIQQKLAAPAKR